MHVCNIVQLQTCISCYHRVTRPRKASVDFQSCTIKLNENKAWCILKAFDNCLTGHDVSTFYWLYLRYPAPKENFLHDHKLEGRNLLRWSSYKPGMESFRARLYAAIAIASAVSRQTDWAGAYNDHPCSAFILLTTQATPIVTHWQRCQFLVTTQLSNEAINDVTLFIRNSIVILQEQDRWNIPCQEVEPSKLWNMEQWPLARC